MKSKPSLQSRLAALSIPHAKMKYPASFAKKIKYLLWYIYTPFHPFGRDLFIALGILKHNYRQPFLIGTMDVNASLEHVVRALVCEGYGSHFIAWEDTGEIVSLRKVEDFVHQYHIRIFEDGEVCAHYEYTPECHPVLHMKENGMENRSSEFLRIIGEYVIPANS